MTESGGVNERAEHRLRASSDQKLHSWAANWIAIQSGKIIHFLGLKYITVSNYFPLKLNKTKSIKKKKHWAWQALVIGKSPHSSLITCKFVYMKLYTVQCESHVTDLNNSTD